MRVILIVLLFLVLVVCNSATVEVVVEETKVEVIVDSVPFIVEEVDKIKTKMEGGQQIELINDTNLVRIND